MIFRFSRILLFSVDEALGGYAHLVANTSSVTVESVAEVDFVDDDDDRRQPHDDVDGANATFT